MILPARILTTALIGAFSSLSSLTASAAKKNLPPYKDARLPIPERVADLLSRMTLEEKVGQLRCTLAWNYYDIQGNNVVPSQSFKDDLAAGQVGMLWGTYRADPWTQEWVYIAGQLLGMPLKGEQQACGGCKKMIDLHTVFRSKYQ